MLKKDITYENPFTNDMVTETHYFHISKADLIQMEMEESSETYTDESGKQLTGMQAKLQRIVDSKDGKEIIEQIRDIIRRSYGLKDGDRFRKSAEIWEDFASSEAYAQLLFDLCTDAGNASEFMNGVIPHNLEQIAAEVVEKAQQESQSAKSDDGEPTTRTLSRKEAIEMEATELQAGISDGRYKLG